jgi:hypothetical protein
LATLSKTDRLELLSNPELPDKYLDELMRIYAKRQAYTYPSVGRVIPNAAILKLPTVCRLEFMENLLANESGVRLKKILEVQNAEQLGELLFGAVAKYYGRVNDAITLYKGKTEVQPRPVP